MRIVTIVCWIISAIVLVGLAVWFLNGSVFGVWPGGWNSNWFSVINIGGWEVLSGPYKAVGEYSYGVTSVDSLNIDWISGEVTVKPYDGNDIRITEFAQRDLRENERLYVSTLSGTLTVKYIERSNSFKMPQKKLEVLIPRALSENLKKLTADNVSGAVIIENAGADALSTSTMSGSINISNSTAQTLYVDSTSGSLTVVDVRADSMELNSMSGSIRISESTAKTLDCNTTSGSVNVSGVFDSVKQSSMSGRLSLENFASVSTVKADTTSGSLDLSGSFNSVNADSMSGSITITSTIIPGALTADTTSGSITVKVPNDGAITVDHSSVSGRFSSDIPVVMQKSGAQFKLSSMSGSTRIIELN